MTAHPSVDGSARALHVRGTLAWSEVEQDVWIVGDRISFEPVADARTLTTSGFLLPGLVDVHCHPGTVGPGHPIDLDVLAEDARTLVNQGVLAIRVPGSASRLPAEFGRRSGEPRVATAGLPVAREGCFFPGWGRQVPESEIVAVAVEEARRTGWAKLIVDWMTDDGYEVAIQAETIMEVVQDVHSVGGRVAAHTQHEDGGMAAVLAGVDSIEHGMHLPLEALPIMADRGTVLVPTAVTFAAMREQMAHPMVPSGLRHWFTSGWARHAELVAHAHSAGVTIFAGTDLPPGSLLAEVHWLAEAGLGNAAAVAAASWRAREWLGLPTVEPDGLADLLVCADDPRAVPETLASPRLIIGRGDVLSGPVNDHAYT